MRLTVHPRGCSTRGQLWDGEVEGRQDVTRSTIPFCDAARALLAEGADPATPLIMRAQATAPGLWSRVASAVEIRPWAELCAARRRLRICEENRTYHT